MAKEKPQEQKSAFVGPIQEDKKHVDYKPGWRKRSLVSMPIVGSNPLVFPKKQWNPDVNPGQEFAASIPKTLSLPKYNNFSKQTNTLSDPRAMKRISIFIDKNYGKGVGKKIANLSPREAVALAHTILSERTEYDSSQLALTNKGNKNMDISQQLKRSGGSLSDDDILRERLKGRHSNDVYSPETILKNKDDKDTVCRNKAQMMIVIFEAIKLLQASDTSLLQTTRIGILSNKIAASGFPYGRLQPEDLEVYKLFTTGELVVMRPDSQIDRNTKEGKEKSALWRLRLLTDEEKKRVAVQPDLEAILQYSYGDYRTEGGPHALVQVMSQDKNGRIQVFPFDVTNESFTGAEKSGRTYIWDALNDWKQDTNWLQMRLAAHEMVKNLPEDSSEKRKILSKFPLLFILSARELKKSPNQDEIDYCKQQLRYIENRHNNSPWYNPRYTSETEQELLTNLALFFIECTPIERQLSDEALELCEKIKGKRDDIPSLNHYKDKTAFLHDILDSKK